MKKVLIRDNKVNLVCLAEHCPKNCCGDFMLTDNLISFWNINERLIPLTDEDYIVFVEKNLSDHLVKELDGGWYIKTDKRGRCPLLEKNKCSIYESRPQCCRGYPFFFNKYNGLCVHDSCPGWGKGWTEISVVKEYVACAEKVYRWHMEKTNRIFD